MSHYQKWVKWEEKLIWREKIIFDVRYITF